jgi:Flp pilus assembly pilin Flp
MSVKGEKKMLRLVNRTLRRGREEEKGQTMTEYALILAAIAIVAIVAYTTLGTTIVGLVNKVIACLYSSQYRARDLQGFASSGPLFALFFGFLFALFLDCAVTSRGSQCSAKFWSLQIQTLNVNIGLLPAASPWINDQRPPRVALEIRPKRG